MKYSNFIATLKALHLKGLTAASLPDSCSTTKIPDSFKLLLPNLAEILHTNHEKLCNKNETIIIFGLQISCTAITSNLPALTNRILYNNRPNRHFCCNISYLTTARNDKKPIKSWENANNIIVDFTSGIVMDTVEYANILFQEQNFNGTTYGLLNQTLLDEAWQLIEKSNYCMEA